MYREMSIMLIYWAVVLLCASGDSQDPDVKVEPPREVVRLRELRMRKAWDSYAYERRAESNSRATAALAGAANLRSAARQGLALTFSVKDYGALGDGQHDDAPAFAAAVAAARKARAEGSKLRHVVYFPKQSSKRYKMSSMLLQNIDELEVRIDGRIAVVPMAEFAAPPEEQPWLSPEQQRMQYAFFGVYNCSDIRITGGGSIDGNGQSWWRIRRRTPIKRAPILLLIRDSSQVSVHLLELTESPFYHLVVLRSQHVALQRLNISAGAGSVNTDGIDVLDSQHVEVVDCWVSTGDDNVAIKEGARDVSVRGGYFARGHGLSIGSLGEGGSSMDSSVRDVDLRDVRFIKTTNAARVKTWRGGAGVVSNVTFANIRVYGVGIPLVVDQFYCAASQHPGPCTNETSAVAITDLTVDGIRGWHTSGVAAMVHCSDAAPCTADLRNFRLEGQPGCSNVIRCWAVQPLTSDGDNTGRRISHTRPCGQGNEMHGYIFDISRQERRQVSRGYACVHPAGAPLLPLLPDSESNATTLPY